MTWNVVASDAITTSARDSVHEPSRVDRQRCRPRPRACAGSAGSTSQTTPNSRSIAVPSTGRNAALVAMVADALPVSTSRVTVQTGRGVRAPGGVTATVDGANTGAGRVLAAGTSGKVIREPPAPPRRIVSSAGDGAGQTFGQSAPAIATRTR